MTESNLHTLENTKMKIADPGKWQKNHNLEMTENTHFEFARMENAQPGKWQNWNCTPKKITEITPRKMTEKKIENARLKIANPGKCQNGKCTTLKMPEGEWPKNPTSENDRKWTIGIC